VIIAPKLPNADNLRQNGCKAIEIAIAISIPPVMFENILVLKNEKVHEKKGLFSASGRIASASCLVNFSSPMPNKISANPYLMTDVKEIKESIVSVFIIKE